MTRKQRLANAEARYDKGIGDRRTVRQASDMGLGSDELVAAHYSRPCQAADTLARPVQDHERDHVLRSLREQFEKAKDQGRPDEQRRTEPNQTLAQVQLRRTREAGGLRVQIRSRCDKQRRDHDLPGDTFGRQRQASDDDPHQHRHQYARKQDTQLIVIEPAH